MPPTATNYQLYGDFGLQDILAPTSNTAQVSVPVVSAPADNLFADHAFILDADVLDFDNLPSEPELRPFSDFTHLAEYSPPIQDENADMDLPFELAYTNITLAPPNPCDSDPAAKDLLPTLHIAARHGHTAIVKILLEHSVDIDERDGEGRTSL